MTTTKMSHAEALKAELMERYGLREDQVRLQVIITTTDLELGQKVLADFDKYEEGNHLHESENCGMVYGEEIDTIYVHRKDGFYGEYVNKEDDDNE